MAVKCVSILHCPPPPPQKEPISSLIKMQSSNIRVRDNLGKETDYRIQSLEIFNFSVYRKTHFISKRWDKYLPNKARCLSTVFGFLSQVRRNFTLKIVCEWQVKKIVIVRRELPKIWILIFFKTYIGYL